MRYRDEIFDYTHVEDRDMRHEQARPACLFSPPLPPSSLRSQVPGAVAHATVTVTGHVSQVLPAQLTHH